MPRKTRKELALVDEDQAQEERDAACRRLKGELHAKWHKEKIIRLSGALPEVEAYPSAL